MLDYGLLKEKTDNYYDKHLKCFNEEYPDEIEKAKLFDFMANILNQIIFDSFYTVKKEDFDFIIKYKIDVANLITDITSDKILNKEELL